MGAVEQIDNILGGIGFAKARKDARDTINMNVGVQVGHGVDGEDNIETAFVSLPGGRFHANAGGDTRENNLRNIQTFQVDFEPGFGERAPRLFGDRVIGRLPIQFRHQFRPIGRTISRRARLLCSAWSATGHVYEHDRLTVATKRRRQSGSVLEDWFDRVRGWVSDDAFLQVDDDESGFGVDGGDGHGFRNLQQVAASRNDQ
jgi:hypothetical protein